MHALLALPVVWVESAPKLRRPDQMGAGSSAIASAEEPTETLILVNIPGVTRSAERDPVTLASRGFAPRDLLISVASPDVAPAVDLSRAVVTEDGETARDPAVVPVGRRAQLLGLYVGQVKARIERAWLRPRSGIVGGVFSCSVTIRQDGHGRIEKVALHACNGSDEWQRSLELAIGSASPLSAPPDPSVFATSLSLSFTSRALAPGQPEDGYESEHASVAAADYVYAVARDGIVELRIVGRSRGQTWAGAPLAALADEPLPTPTSTVEGPDLANTVFEY